MVENTDDEELLESIFRKLSELAAAPRRTQDPEKVKETSSRQDYLRRMALRRIGLSSRPKNDSIFISFSEGGERFAKQIREEVRSRKVEVVGTTGFDREFDISKINEIWTSIARCDAFLGVWSGEHRLGAKQEKIERSDDSRGIRDLLFDKSEHNIYLPSPWMPVELGMALSLNKPWVLVVDKRVDRKFVLKICGDQHHMFEDWIDETAVEGKGLRRWLPSGNKLARRRRAEAYYRGMAKRACNSAIFRNYAGIFGEDENGSTIGDWRR
ncbi:MAG: hypothetical protein JOZ72_04385 [Alphaproteobacteria bacterium]|nr:hypothetical protein [Alphaproteobacteria bacterium]